MVHGAVVWKYGLASDLGASGTHLVVDGLLLVSWAGPKRPEPMIELELNGPHLDPAEYSKLEFK